jgi:DNA-binding MarR family transcriptional regulator
MLRIFPEMMRALRCGFTPDIGIPINHTEFRTVMELYFNPGMPMKHYARTAGVEYGSFTYLADKLEEKGLIRRCSAQDKRCTTLCLTPEGTRSAEELRAQFDAHAAARLEALNAEERAELKAAVRTLEHTLERLERQHGSNKA